MLGQHNGSWKISWQRTYQDRKSLNTACGGSDHDQITDICLPSFDFIHGIYPSLQQVNHHQESKSGPSKSRSPTPTDTFEMPWRVSKKGGIHRLHYTPLQKVCQIFCSGVYFKNRYLLPSGFHPLNVVYFIYFFII